MTIARRLLTALLFFSSFVATASPARREPEPAQVREHEAEGECLADARKDWIGRHGVADPEVLLYLARETYEERRAASNYQSDGIAGSVWTSLGPTNESGRIGRLALHPTIAGTMLAGSASGGVWRTTDGGGSWAPLTDSIPNLFVGAVAYAPSAPSTIYVGTGEGDDPKVSGIGLIWSNDGGNTWNFPSSVIAEQFYAISVNPGNPNDIVIGTKSGGFRSTNGPDGPWTNVLPASSWGKVTDIERDPTNPSLLYAGTFSINENISSTVVKSVDGGATWSPINNGLPVSGPSLTVTRFAIAIAPSSPNILYAAADVVDYSTGAQKSHIYRTSNGGASWSETALALNPDGDINHYIIQYDYDNTIAVSPSNPNVVVAAGVYYVRTTDGGASWSAVLDGPHGSTNYVHVDCHELLFDSSGVLHIGNDGGYWSSNDNASTAISHNSGLITRQYYAIANDPANPNRIFGGQQDNGTNRRRDAGGTIWDDMTYGDGLQCAVNDNISDYALSSSQAAHVYGTSEAGAATPYWPEVFPPLGGGFFSIITKDPVHAGTVYTINSRLWKSTTWGRAWAPLPTTMADGTVWPSGWPLAIAVAPSAPQTLMVAFEDSVARSTDGGLTWRTVDNGRPSKWVNSIDIDPADPSLAYAAIGSVEGNSLYFTSDGGASWTSRSSGLPNYAALVVRIDPTDRNTLYCGTAVGVYRSTNQGLSWSRFGTGLPAVSVYDLRIFPDGSRIRAGTFGRGVWELTATGATNRSPEVFVSPAGEMLVAKGTKLSFRGTMSDPDSDDTLAGVWTFADTWETFATADPNTSITHTFATAGTYKISLKATDAAGAVGIASVIVHVRETADDCATPIVIPSAMFPASVSVTAENGSAAAADPYPYPNCPFELPNSIWLSFTPPESGSYTFSLRGSDDAALEFFTGSPCGPLTPIAGACMRSEQNEDLTLQLSGGVPLSIMAGGGKMSVTVLHNNYDSIVTVTSSTPAAGPPAGGTEVILQGSGFNFDTRYAWVTFDGVDATSVRVAENNIITATAPPHAPGPVNISVFDCPGGFIGCLPGGRLVSGFVYTDDTPAAPFPAVASFDGSTVSVSWSPVQGADHYEIARRSAGPFAVIGTSTSTSFTDSTAASGKAYVYEVRSVGPGPRYSAYSAPDLCTTMSFTDLIAGTTVVEAAHFNQLRTAVNYVRAAGALPAFDFSQPVAPGAVITNGRIQELQAALDEGRHALALPPGAYGNPIGVGSPIRAADVETIRDNLK